MTEPKKRIIGKPFLPGVGGGGKGRHKLHAIVADAARSHAPEAIDTLVICMRECRRIPGKDGAADTFVDYVAQPDVMRASKEACVALLDRGVGKPTQSIEINEETTNRAMDLLLGAAKPRPVKDVVGAVVDAKKLSD